MPPFSARSFCLTSTLAVVDAFADAIGNKAAGVAWKKAEKLLMDPVGIKILPSKPHHAYQEREQEIEDVQARFDQLKKDNVQSQIVVGVYIKGSPASGKTQLARAFGERYYERLILAREIGGILNCKAVVATLDASNSTSFLWSYLRLAKGLGLPVNRYNVPGSTRDRVLLSIEVQKALAEKAPNWLLIIDGIDPWRKLMLVSVESDMSCFPLIIPTCRF